MEELKKYKDVWKKQEHVDRQINASTITKMIHRKSSSIVKWIFYISLMEFSVFILLDIFSKKDWVKIKETNMYYYTLISFVLFYSVILFFIYLFYKNYKSISVTNDTRSLLKSILKTRQSVRYYIITNIVMLAVGTLIAAYILFKDAGFTEMIEELSERTGYNGNLIVWSVTIIIILVAVGILLLIYQLLYGILLRKLNANYKELIN